MNLSYTTLGEGRNTAVLFDTGNGTHRKVTTTDHDVARQLTYALDRLHHAIGNALWDVAVAYDGRPADARRRLLDVFDRTVAGVTVTVPGDCWALSRQLVSAVADLLAGQPAPVVAAVRREVADVCLVDLDGVLVGGVLVAECYRPGFLRLVVNQTMRDWTSTGADGATATFSPFFDGLDDHALALASTSMDPTIGVPTGVLYADDIWMVVDQLREETSCHESPYAEASARSLFASSGDEYPYLEVVPTHLRAWMTANRPDVLEAHPHVGA